MLMLSGRGTGAHGSAPAQAVDFDGTNDYLSRNSDLVGNADGNTFTFSAWFYVDDLSEDFTLYTTYQSGFFFRAVWRSSGSFEFRGKSAGGVENLLANFAFSPARDTMYHIVASMNLANTGQRYIYLLDTMQSVSYSPYSATGINFTTPNHYICEDGAGTRGKGRLAHVFLAYEYIDLSIESNRRIFITADRKPA